ncbi:poly [ADP-ribose] polymerase [Achroia grisella]|uniref:poly [ADP-ribose] polymerase n=1 Tax=Achroia grisella TaxID=688607 RepID=UPI0027D23B1D|nr:poly [ADP-ribose] polymerase [Achroia grisella]
MTDLPYQVEYAKSGRASCKGCKQKIDQGVLRIARMVQSAFHDGKQPNWYHEDCFFTKQRPTSVDEISNFNKLKSVDQKKLQSRIGDSNSGVVLPVEETKGKKRKAGKSSEVTSGAVKDFAVEYSKSSRATCRHCEIKICKGEVRISKTVFDTEVGAKYGGQPLWHHVKCFAEARSELLYFAGGENLPGFKTLKKEDQELVTNEIKPFQSNELPVKKLKDEPKDPAEIKEAEKKEKLIDKQNKLYQKYKNALADLPKNDLQVILEENSQAAQKLSKSECEDCLADCMAFGALEPCSECKNGQLILDTFGYKCTGHISDWTKCSYTTQDPKRKLLKIPSSYKNNPAFSKYKSKVDIRAFRTAAPPATLVNLNPKSETSVKKEIRIPPLKNLQFFIYGISNKKSKETLKNRILKLGGLVVNKQTETLAAVISTAKEIEKLNAKMEDIKAECIEVIDESFFDLIDPEKGTVTESLRLIKENNIADWGSDPATRVPQDIIDGKSIPKSGSMYVKSEKSGSVKLKIQAGSAVDPDSGLTDCAHVYKDEEGTKFTVVLSKTDLVSQKNSYYKLQLLQSDNNKKYWLFRSWGRIGTTIGGNKLEHFEYLYEALDEFCKYYTEKTQNNWGPGEQFTKVPGFYYPLDVDYGNSEVDSKTSLIIDENSSLPISVQKFIQRIFDIDAMKKTLLEFELDTEKMPLGKLSQKQIKIAYGVLSELLKYIEKGSTSQNKIIDATNRFFTLIPHDFGVNNPPLLDNTEIIKSKCEMLDNMLEIEIAYSMLSADMSSHKDVSVLEDSYRKLKTEIVPLDVDSEEYQMIAEYTKNTHGATHSSYKLNIQQAFKVVRDGEEKRYKPFKKLHNRRLLWHGSRVTNFAGILSQGLRIAPPEAPVTGYMFGKGIYFADMVTKSANYCFAHRKDPVGVMLLCEVALGNMKECERSEYVTKLPADRHSVWGIGITQPDPAQARTLPDGTIVPLGPPVDLKNRNVSLLYNEFIVYDVAQVNVKYVMEMKFDFKY